MKRLKAEYQELADDFVVSYEDAGCSCHQSPPCGYCTHEGHPENLAETPEAWVEMLELDQQDQEQILLGDDTPALKQRDLYFVANNKVNRLKIAKQYEYKAANLVHFSVARPMMAVPLVDIERIFGGVA